MMSDLKLPKIPFTMKEFEAENNLHGLGMKHYKLIHARLRELGFIRVRKWRGKGHPEKVWVRPETRQPVPELEEKLRGLLA